jgi:hypothetical protein
MAKLFVVHWDRDELDQLVGPLVQAKHLVRGHWSTKTTANLKELPDMIIISLERLPSHGKAIAEWMWEAKKRQTIPIVFVGGNAKKVEPLKTQFPKAKFCSVARLPMTIEKLAMEGTPFIFS